MKGDDLPSSDHVLRQCRQGDLKYDPDGTIRGVFPDALQPDEDGISVTWLEFFEGSPSEQLTAARAAMNRGRRLRVSNRLARLNVGYVLSVGISLRRSVSVVHDPIEAPAEKENLGHSL